MKTSFILLTLSLVSCGKIEILGSDGGGSEDGRPHDSSQMCTDDYKFGQLKVEVKTPTAISGKIFIKRKSEDASVSKYLLGECENSRLSVERAADEITLSFPTHEYPEVFEFDLYHAETCDDEPELIKEGIVVDMIYESVNPAGSCHDYVKTGTGKVDPY